MFLDTKARQEPYQKRKFRSVALIKIDIKYPIKI